jgi:hypothetical protein
MPCYVTGSAEGDAELAAADAIKELTKVTRLLCLVCKEAEKNNGELPKSVWDWWEKHSKQDKANK